MKALCCYLGLFLSICLLGGIISISSFSAGEAVGWCVWGAMSLTWVWLFILESWQGISYEEDIHG
jgi:predicted transporter